MTDEQNENNLEDTFPIGVVSKLKHGAFLEALEKRGWTQHQGAEFLGLDDSRFAEMINMKWVPKKISPEFERKLFELTGKLLDELWPADVFTPEFLGTEKQRVTVRDVPRRVLQATASALQLLPAQPDEEYDQTEMREIMAVAIATLNPSEQKVIRARFFENKDLSEVAREMKVAQTRVREIERKALTKLRHPSRSRGLKSFLMPVR